MSQHFIHRAGVRLAYERRGSGPPILLLQGLGMSGRMWLTLPGGLLKAGYTVITPDSRGTGLSDTPAPPYSMKALAADAAAVLEDARVPAALVVGISLGGMVAQHLALRFPERVRGLVLAATTCGVPHGRPPRPGTIALLVRGFLSSSPATGAMIQRRLAHPASLQRTPGLFRPWSRALAQFPPRPAGVFGQMAAAGLHSAGRMLGRLRCPVEVITGADDQIIPPVNSAVLARLIPAAEHTVVPEAGHVFPLEHPRSLHDAIRRTCARCGP